MYPDVSFALDFDKNLTLMARFSTIYYLRLTFRATQYVTNHQATSDSSRKHFSFLVKYHNYLWFRKYAKYRAWNKFQASKGERLSAQGRLFPDLLIRGSAAKPHSGLRFRTPVIGSRTSLDMCHDVCPPRVFLT